MTEHNRRDQMDKGSQNGLPLSTPARPRTTVEHESSGSPKRPSYSPVTPTLSHTSLASHDGAGVDLPPAQWMDDPPEPLPVSLNDNPDAMALRATLSILQIQRQKALRDMQELDKMKNAALGDPEQFVKDLQAGKLSRSPRSGVDFDELGPVTAEDKEVDSSKFGHFPPAQNIVRTPPVEWARYHIVGEPLERIHKTQQQYPGATDEPPETQDRLRPHAIAAPYRPFVDKLDQARTPSNPRNLES